MNYDQVEQK